MLFKYLIPVLLVCIVAACGQPVQGKNGITYKSAVQYNDYIVSRQTQLIKNVSELRQIANINLDSAEARLNQYVAQTAGMIDEIKGMPPYKGDSSLREAAVSSFSFYKKVFEKDYMAILRLKRKADSLTEEDVNTANLIIEKIGKEEEAVDKKFHEAQKRYASMNNMKLIDNKMQKELENAGTGN